MSFPTFSARALLDKTYFFSILFTLSDWEVSGWQGQFSLHTMLAPRLWCWKRRDCLNCLNTTQRLSRSPALSTPRTEIDEHDLRKTRQPCCAHQTEHSCPLSESQDASIGKSASPAFAKMMRNSSSDTCPSPAPSAPTCPSPSPWSASLISSRICSSRISSPVTS